MPFRIRTHSVVAAAIFLVFTAMAATATAQDKEDEQKKDEEVAGPLGEELENYWSVERDLPVLQEKLFSRKLRFGIGVHAGLLSSEPFYGYIPVGGRLSFFFSDSLGIEVDGNYYGPPGEETGPLTYQTEITDFFEERLEDDFTARTDLEDRFLWQANAVIVWNPLYGKWSFLNNKLSHFDFNVVVGGGVISVDRPLVDRTDAEVVLTPEVVFGPGISFFLNEHLTVRADGRFYAYQGAESETQTGFFKRLEMPAEFQLGVTYLF